MTAAADHFRQLLEAGDVDGCRAAWAKAAPHLPQARSRVHAEIVMHMTRTASATVTFKVRAYSHRWLTERELPSQLPDNLRPRAERLYPAIADAVGIAVRASNPVLAPAVLEVRKSMEVAVEEAYADGRKDPVFVKQRMQEARERTWRSLFGV